MNRTGALITTACLAISGGLQADTLSLDAFVRRALEHNPQAAAARAAALSSRAGYTMARSKLLPHVNGTARAGRQGGSQDAGLSGGGSANQYAATVSASQHLFDFGKTSSLARQGLFLSAASREDEREARTAVALNARLAYFNFLLVLRLDDVARETLKQAQQHLTEAQVQFETGKLARYGVTKAAVDVANANVALIKADNDIALARIQLETAAGCPFTGDPVLSDSLDSREIEVLLEQALFRADSARPELRSARLKLEAAAAALRSQRAALLPSLDASADYGYHKSGGGDWYRSWSFGATATVPLFESGALVAGIDQAAAGVMQAQAALDQTKQGVSADIKQRLLEKQEAQDRIAAAAQYVAQARQGLELSQERFHAGAASPLEVTDAEAALAKAKSSHAQALFDYRAAHSRLLAAMGAL